MSAFLGITTMLNYMMAVEDFDRYDLSSLRLIKYGGGPMAESVVREIMERFPCDLMQGYGQTEGCTMSTLPPWVHREIRAGIGTHRAASCGLEVHLTSVRVVDEAGVPVARDRTTVGEIVVRRPREHGRLLAPPDLTADVFRDGGGWMRTGDVAAWDEDGFVYIVDRAKDMVISGGENIYPAQVEACLYRHPAVLECAVFGVPDPTWGEALKAVVVLRPGMSATESRDHRARAARARELHEAEVGRLHRRAAEGPDREDPQARPARTVLGRPRARSVGLPTASEPERSRGDERLVELVVPLDDLEDLGVAQVARDGYSSETPYAPWIWKASVADWRATSEAVIFAIDAASRARSPWSLRYASR